MVSVFKKIASYLFDLTLEKRKSDLSGELTVSIHKGQYKLSTQDAIYSFGNEYTSFSTVFKALHIEKRTTEKVLILGFGLGSIVDLLRNNTSIKNITALDADKVVIELAKKYLNPALQEKVEFRCTDALYFTQNCIDAFDLVVFDVFIEDKTPVQFMQQEFLFLLKNLVKHNGLLLYSKMEDSLHSKIENYQFSKSFSSIFADAYTITTEGNRVYVWNNK